MNMKFDAKQKLMMISLNLRTLNTARKDKKVTREVILSHDIQSPDAVRLIKDIIDPAALKPYKRVRDMLRQWFYEQTLDYPIKGWRVQTNIKFPKFVEEMRQGIALLNQAADEFCKDYPTHVKNAEGILRGMYDPAMYPPMGEIRSKFGADFDIAPFPDSSGLVVDLVDAELNAAKNQVDALQEQAVDMALKDVYHRFASKLTHISERMSDPDNMFHSSMLDKFKELVELIPEFNVFEDQGLEDLRKIAKDNICCYDVDELRDDPDYRTKVKSSADDILSRMGLTPGKEEA